MTPCDRREDERVVDSSGKKVKTRKSIVSGRRVGGGGGDSDGGDDDFMPTKKAVAAKSLGGHWSARWRTLCVPRFEPLRSPR